MNKMVVLIMSLVLCVSSVTVTWLVIKDRAIDKPISVEIDEQDNPTEEPETTATERRWSFYMDEWLQTNRLVIDYLNVKEKEWCAVAIQRIAPPDPEHPGAIPVEPIIDCIN